MDFSQISFLFFVTLSLTEDYKWFPVPVDLEQMDGPDARFTIL